MMHEQQCPQCQAPYDEGDRFCEFCGQPLYTARPKPTAAPAPVVSAENRSSTDAIAHLILQNGQRFRLIEPELWIGRSDPASNWYPAIDLSGHGGAGGGVSRRHGRLLIVGNQLFIEDVGSSNGTTLNGKALTVGQRLPLLSGDELLFGRVYARVKFVEKR